MPHPVDDAAYYIEYAKAYFDKTHKLDSSAFLEPFASRLGSHASILDLGCGSGRDLRWLKSKGFRPVGFERSPVLAQMARDLSGCPVVEGDFLTHDFSGIQVKALLFSASLVHLPHHQVTSAIDNALYALEGQGVVYVSLKKGEGFSMDAEGRRFSLWTDGDLRMLFSQMGFTIMDFRTSPSVRDTGETWLSYTLHFDKNKPLFRYPARLIQPSTLSNVQ